MTVNFIIFTWLSLLAKTHPGFLGIPLLSFGVMYAIGRVVCWREPHIFNLLAQRDYTLSKNRKYYQGYQTYEPY
jgi:type IV secretory pathway VirB3-like protein